MAMNQGRDPMKGRTGVGGKLASPGKIRSGQSEPASNKFTTRTKKEFSRKAPYVPDNANTSDDAQAMIKEAPDPFKNRMQAPQMPAPSGPRGAKPGLEPKGIYAGKKGSSVGQSNPSGGAVGYSKLPNQSKQIGGRMGFPPPKRNAGNNTSGQPSRRNASFYGDN